MVSEHLGGQEVASGAPTAAAWFHEPHSLTVGQQPQATVNARHRMPGDGGGGGRVDGGRAPRARVRGCALAWQQLRALLMKRALCSSRERLTLLTQLLAPLALVALALWVSNLSIRGVDEAPLVLDRSHALLGGPTVLAAPEDIRLGSRTAWAAWMAAQCTADGAGASSGSGSKVCTKVYRLCLA
jgi:hypothetical protein